MKEILHILGEVNTELLIVVFVGLMQKVKCRSGKDERRHGGCRDIIYHQVLQSRRVISTSCILGIGESEKGLPYLAWLLH